tara:strand:+ start:180 stop:1025 length:846 start_codon:yes stop_codon:yes gene_type:complete
MTNNIGVMQGRLTERGPHKLQSFPINNWMNEFKLCSEIGLKSIEWVIDSNYYLKNPIFSDILIHKIKKLSENYKINITAVCNDLLMDFPLNDKNNIGESESYFVLKKLVKNCNLLGIKFIDLPLIAKSKIRSKGDLNRLFYNIEKLSKLAIKCGVTFLFETDLKPEQNLKLIKRFDGLPVGLNYDTGNSAYWKFDPNLEIDLFGNWIKNVHIKDCLPKIYSVPLGEGNVDFDLIMKKLSKIGYDGDFILQTAYKPKETCKNIIKSYYEFTKKYVNKYFNGT